MLAAFDRWWGAEGVEAIWELKSPLNPPFSKGRQQILVILTSSRCVYCLYSYEKYSKFARLK